MSQSAGKKKKYPINRPRTRFSMKANLVQREPAFQKRWEKIDLYRRCRQADHPAGPFFFHDGPPYANGDIHMGHLLNKVLKDLVVRSKTMAGFDVDFVPGWDCHGLPIEHKVLKEQQDPSQAKAPGAATEADTGRIMHIRRKCKSYAEKYVKLQARQMQRLGTTGDYDHPYITMDRDYEAGVLEVFADLVGKDLVYRQLKPVHWSIANQTALADAELEYYDREDTSVYVEFPVDDPQHLPKPLNAPADQTIHLMIWTTTPWTLPANMAVAVSLEAEYSLFEYQREDKTGYVIMAEDLHRQIFEMVGLGDESGHRRLGTCRGSDLVDAGLRYRHPFIERTSPVVWAEYVTLEDGTGLVHTAPGHGVEDWQTGLREKLNIYCPVQADGTFDDTAPEWLRGRSVWEANGLVVEHLRQSGHLFHDHPFTHSYPHDWRSKTPVIFRATEQWFISADRTFTVSAGPEGRADNAPENACLRDRALEATAEQIHFIPEWGRNRMRGMLESRPDWCISRQRAWGLPIPAFEHVGTGIVLLTQKSVEAVAANIRKHGSDYWFAAETVADLLEGYDVDNDDDAPVGFKQGAFDPSTLRRSTDIFDVWFESGSSWHACMEQRGLKRRTGPVTDLYLEGSDQHRGWFQLSLLPCLGVRGVSPFKTVLTHGFMVDAQGQKMSKSGGNAIAVEDLLKEHGADVCRWWVAGLNCANDVKVDWSFFGIAADEYRKVRNTIRFVLSNLDDFDPSSDRRPITDDDRYSIDAWAHGQLAQVVDTVRASYEKLDFRRAAQVLFDFCNETLSAVYLAAVKDRLYCDKPDSDRRRRTQTVLYEIADSLVRLVAPILVHTADEAWLALDGQNPDQPDSDDSVHLQPLPEPIRSHADPHWAKVMALRDRALKALEDARAQRGLDNPLDAGIEAAVPVEEYERLKPFEPELADLCGVSRFMLDENGDETIGVEDLTHQPRCARSWKRDGTVSPYTDADGDPVDLTRRDAEALGLA